MRKSAIALAITICVGLPSGTSALAGQAARGEMRVVVSYGDLDTSRPAGARVLINRLRVAASQVCGGEPYIRDLTSRARYRTCTRQAMDVAVASIGAPLVVALYGEPVLEALAQR